MKALVTGFEPFGGDRVNPSLEALRRLPARLGTLDIEIRALPVVYGQALPALYEAIAATKPDIVLCAGLAGGRPALSLERVAINIDDARIPDNLGRQPIDAAVVAGGPAAYFSTLPIKALAHDMRGAGVAAAVSNTAGTFVCNHILYALMDIAGRHPTPLRGGFLHVPYAPEQIAKVGTAPSMAVADITRGIEIILQVSAARTTDIHTAEGKVS